MAISNLLPFKDAYLNLCETGYAAQGLPLERPRQDSDDSIMAARMNVQLGAMKQLAEALGAGKLEAHFMPDGLTTTKPVGRTCFKRLNLLRVSKLFSTSRLPNNTPIPEQLSELKDGSLYLDRDEFERWQNPPIPTEDPTQAVVDATPSPSKNAPPKRKTGKKPEVFPRVFKAMRADVARGVDLDSMKIEEMKSAYKASAYTCTKARNAVLEAIAHKNTEK